MAAKLTNPRGWALWPALVFVFAACAPAVHPPEPGGLEGLARAQRRGDLAAVRKGLGLESGLSHTGRELAEQLDPRAWLVAMGASWREHDLKACRRALASGDDRALAAALGFGEQALQADVLQAGRTVFSRRSSGMDYFESGKAPGALVTAELAPVQAPGVLAVEFTYWADAEGRTARLRVGLRGDVISNLQATADAALDSPPAARDHGRVATAALAGAGAAPLALPELGEAHWLGLEARAVLRDGEMITLRLSRDDRGWYAVEQTRQTMAQRLEAERDRRLELVRRLASDLQRSAGRWPAREDQITLRPVDLCDPAADSARRGWADHDSAPPRGIRLLQPAADADPAVECIQAVGGRRRAITRNGQLVWIAE